MTLQIIKLFDKSHSYYLWNPKGFTTDLMKYNRVEDIHR